MTNSKVLLAGAWAGEFGWELCTWIPALRNIASNYDKVVVACAPWNNYLYEDFVDLFEDYRNKKDGDMWFQSRFPTIKPKMPKKLKEKYIGSDIIIPNKYMCMKAPRKYFMYGKKTDEKGYDVVIHARAEDKYGQSKLNYSPLKYKKMLKQLRLKQDIKACSIGTKAYHIDETTDYRGVNMTYLCYILRNSKVCVGTSSGVMHLSHLCGCPIVVLTDDKKKKGIKATNRERYKKIWRAFPDVPVKVIDNHGWHPPVATITKAVRKFL